MRKIARLAYVAFETPNIDAQVDYYTNIIGLTLTERTPEAAYLSATVDHHTVVLAQGDAPRCRRLGMQLSEDIDFPTMERELSRMGVQSERRHDAQPAISEQLSFVDPDDMGIDVFREHKAAGHRPSGKGANPVKLSHVACNVLDVQRTVPFYEQALGMKISDWIGDFFAFMRAGPDHHTVNFVNGRRAKMHHMAFEVQDSAAINANCDMLAMAGYPIVWGPVRHGPGHNISIYHRNPDQQIIELCCELDRVVDERLGWFEPRPCHEFFPQMPMVWTDIPKANALWGGQPPASFLE